MSTGDTSGDHRWALVATTLGFAVVQLDVSVVNVALPTIGRELHGSTAALQWVVSAYTVVFAALILVAGATGDRVGAKRVFLIGFGIFTLASVACGLAPTLELLIAARAVQGVGAAILVPCSLALLTHAYDDAEERGKAVGIWAAGASVALSAGPLVGGLLTATIGWRAIFFLNVPLGVVAVLLSVKFSHETGRQSDRRLDVVGALLAALSLAVLAFAVISGGQIGFDQPIVLAGIGAGVVLIAAFVFVEAHVSGPMLPLQLFRSSTFAVSNGVGLLVNIAFYGLIFVLSLFFQHIQHLSALATGLAFVPLTAAVLATNLSAARLVSRFGAGSVICAGSLLMLIGVVPLIVVGSGTAFAWMVVPFVLLGAGLGLIVPAMTSSVLAAVEASDSGVASGTLNSARQTGSVLGVAIFGALGGGSVVTSMHLSALVSAALVAGIVPLGIVLQRTRRRPS